MNVDIRHSIFFSVVITLVSLKSLVANSPNLQNRVELGQQIDQCVQSITKPGSYILHIGRPWFTPECIVYIRSPYRTRVRLTFPPLNLHCSKSSVKVIDGFKIVDTHKRKIYNLPEEVSNGSRQIDLCTVDRTDNVVVEVSQNAAQISYRLASSDKIFVLVEFVKVEPTCNVVLSGEIDGEYVLSNNGRAGDCRWYIAGGVVLTMEEMHLTEEDTPNCVQATSNFAVRSSSIGWNRNEMTINKVACGTHNERAELLIPCKFTRLELHTNSSTLQWVKFRLRLAGDAEKEPGSYFCYPLQYANSV